MKIVLPGEKDRDGMAVLIRPAGMLDNEVSVLGACTSLDNAALKKEYLAGDRLPFELPAEGGADVKLSMKAMRQSLQHERTYTQELSAAPWGERQFTMYTYRLTAAVPAPAKKRP